MKFNLKKSFVAFIIILSVTTTYAKATKKEKTTKTTESTKTSRISSKKKLQEEAIVMPSVPVTKQNEDDSTPAPSEPASNPEEISTENVKSEPLEPDETTQKTDEFEQNVPLPTIPDSVTQNYGNEEKEESPIATENEPELPIIPPVIDTTQQVDRYKKVYLSDFMDIPDYDLPSDTLSSDADFITDLNDVDSLGRTSLMNAVRAGNDWKVRALLGAGADINAKDNDGWTALMYAVRYQSNLPILNILLENNPDVRTLNNYGLSALVLASCYNDNPDIIKKMLSYYSPSEKEVQKAFVLLLSTQSISEYTLIAKMKVFIDLGLPINSYYDGKTPLMYACKFSSSTKAIKLLVDNNATISVRSSDGKTAFEYATENKNLKRDDIYWSLNKR